MKAETPPGALDLGPYETEEQARNAPLAREVKALHDAGHARNGDPNGFVQGTKIRHLMAACADAGVDVGDHDFSILTWLTTWEPETIQVIVGLIIRAAGSSADAIPRMRIEAAQMRAEVERLKAALDAVDRELYEGTREGVAAIVDKALGVEWESIGGPRPIKDEFGPWLDERMKDPAFRAAFEAADEVDDGH
jgi:hypothetical protein